VILVHFSLLFLFDFLQESFRMAKFFPGQSGKCPKVCVHGWTGMPRGLRTTCAESKRGQTTHKNIKVPQGCLYEKKKQLAHDQNRTDMTRVARFRSWMMTTKPLPFQYLISYLNHRGLVVTRQGRKRATPVTLVRFRSCASRFSFSDCPFWYRPERW